MNELETTNENLKILFKNYRSKMKRKLSNFNRNLLKEWIFSEKRENNLRKFPRKVKKTF